MPRMYMRCMRLRNQSSQNQPLEHHQPDEQEQELQPLQKHQENILKYEIVYLLLQIVQIMMNTQEKWQKK